MTIINYTQSINLTKASSLKLYDTMSGSVRNFVSLKSKNVLIYLCGATVHGLPHIGHIRSGIIFDILRRWLIAKGYNVTLVRNITDIDDKIISKSAKFGCIWWEWATVNEKAFNIAYDLVGLLPPSVEPKATGHIPQIIELIRSLIKCRHAYISDGNVYFDIGSLSEYGVLSGNKNIESILKSKLDITPKRNKRDFTLWKNMKPGEPYWLAPWGNGRPGWHTECVAMCNNYLGEEFDIHAGGMDLIFPHHENEIAQARAMRNNFARYWLHNGWVTINNEKMSKSFGNVILVENILKKVRAVELRYYLSSVHYRSSLEFSENALQDAVKSFNRIETFLNKVNNQNNNITVGNCTAKFADALNNDLSVPAALAEIHTARAEGNYMLSCGDYEGAINKAASIRYMMKIIGCDPLDKKWKSQKSVPSDLAVVNKLLQYILNTRNKAKLKHNWAEADAIRKELKKANINIIDTNEGTKWTLINN